MKKKIKIELSAKSVKDLALELVKLKTAVAKRRAEIRTGKSKNTNLCRLTDDCAVVSTILEQKKAKENTI